MRDLDELYRCKSQIERVLLEFTEKLSRSRIKRRRLDKTSETEFLQKIKCLRKKWNERIGLVLSNHHDCGVYDKIAHDLVKTHAKFCASSEICHDQLGQALRCTFTPIIGHIMDESEFTKKSSERQERRKYLLEKLLTVELPLKTAMNETHRDSPDVIDVCSDDLIDIENSGIDPRTKNRHNQPERRIRVRVNSVTLNLLLNLFDALTKQTRLVTNPEFNFKQSIRYTVNIMHVFEVLNKFFDLVRIQLEDDITYGADPSSNMNLLYKNMEEYESILERNSDSIEPSNIMSIFKRQVDTLLFKLKSLRPMFRRQ